MTPRELEVRLERLHPESFGWALSCCAGNATQADDVLQTAYVRIISGRAVFAERSAFRTWLFGVIRRVALEEGRRLRRDEHRTVWLDEPEALALADEHSATDDVLSAADVKDLQDALARLPGRQREVLHLVFYQDLSIAEAADVMEISVGSARTHYERGKARLRALLGARRE